LCDIIVDKSCHPTGEDMRATLSRGYVEVEREIVELGSINVATTLR